MDLAFNTIAAFAAVGVGFILNPIIMWITRAVYLKNREDTGFLKIAKVSVVFSGFLLFLTGMLFLVGLVGGRLGIKGLIAGCGLALGGIWMNAKYMLEREEVDELTITVLVILLHAGLYYGFNLIL